MHFLEIYFKGLYILSLNLKISSALLISLCWTCLVYVLRALGLFVLTEWLLFRSLPQGASQNDRNSHTLSSPLQRKLIIHAPFFSFVLCGTHPFSLMAADGQTHLCHPTESPMMQKGQRLTPLELEQDTGTVYVWRDSEGTLIFFRVWKIFDHWSITFGCILF